MCDFDESLKVTLGLKRGNSICQLSLLEMSSSQRAEPERVEIEVLNVQISVCRLSIYVWRHLLPLRAAAIDQKKRVASNVDSSTHPTRKNAKSRLVELKSPMVQPFGRSKTITLELVHSVLKIIKISLKMLFNLQLFQPIQCISWSLNIQLIDFMIDFRCQ